MNVPNYQQLEEELAKVKADKQLELAFWANMGHDIRTPINSIVGFARLMAETNDEEEKKEYLEIIEENNELLLRIVNDVLDLSQLATHTLQIKKDTFNVGTIIEENCRSAQLKNKNEMLQIVADMDECADMQLYSDRIRINQILMNFINNALKYSVEGTIHVGCRKCSGEDFVRFYVSDTGKGIPEARQQDVFERYVRLENGGSGFGLGLSICKQLVALLDGQIGVVSKENVGSTFWFKLPSKCDQTPPVDNPETKVEKEDKGEPTLPLLLIAEDDVSNFHLEELILRHDFRILHAWDGAEAVELYKEWHPDLILMDINMPTMNGYQSFEKIRSLDAKIPVIAVTAYAMSNEEEEIMAAGFNGYLSKPIRIGTFKETVSKFLK